MFLISNKHSMNMDINLDIELNMTKKTRTTRHLLKSECLDRTDHTLSLQIRFCLFGAQLLCRTSPSSPSDDSSVQNWYTYIENRWLGIGVTNQSSQVVHFLFILMLLNTNYIVFLVAESCYDIDVTWNWVNCIDIGWLQWSQSRELSGVRRQQDELS